MNTAGGTSRLSPRIRFKGLKGDWTKGCLENLGSTISGVGFPEVEQGGIEGIPFFKVSDMNLPGNEVFMNRAANYVSAHQIQNRKWHPIEKTPAVLFAKVGAAALLNRKRMVVSPFLLDNNMMAFCLNEGVESAFVKSLFETFNFTKFVQVGALPSINGRDVENAVVAFPSLPEQRRIASFFANLDETIAAADARLGKLRQTKAAMLDKMFPRPGQTIPEIRFKGFEGEWKKLKLGDAFPTILPNNTFSRSELSEDGLVKNVHYGDVLIRYGSVLNVETAIIPFVGKLDFVSKRQSLLQNGDVIFADTAEDEAVGKMVEIQGVSDQKVVSGLHTIALRPALPFGIGFMGCYLNSSSYRTQLRSIMQGVKVLSVGKRALFETVLTVPSLPEQRRIGTFFQEMDSFISATEAEAKKLRQVKAALLEGMFVQG